MEDLPLHPHAQALGIVGKRGPWSDRPPREDDNS
jgi:hypothetical protein